MKYRSSANCQLGEVYMMEGKPGRALEFLRRALDYDVHSIKAQQVLATACRLFKQPDDARKALNRILEIDPLNHLARFEHYLLEPEPQKLDVFKSLIRNEIPHETYLEIAMYYVSLGLEEDALRLLEVAPEQPAIRYWQAYLLRDRLPQRSREILRKASSLSPYLVFPFRGESIPVFQWADRSLPGDWKAKYYLGLIYWGLRRQEDALKALADCGDRPDFAPAYICRAWLERDSDPKKALADFERAHAVDPNDWRNWRRLANFCSEQGMHERAMTLAVEASRRFPDEDLIRILLARTYLNNGRYRDCYTVLEKATILPFEGQRDVHDLFVQCQICLAMEAMKKGRFGEAIRHLEDSKEYPERLGTGKPQDPDYRVQDYLMMLAYGEMGESAGAEEARGRIAEYASRNPRRAAEGSEAAVDQWYRMSFKSQSELEALRALTRLVQASRPRRN
ncbi:MAG: tetratricopeptide repeat protein [Acidobacteria bacterium]|nr:tetratricopeptide repeat protein [Acidobacteriota bacterium]